jgi:hypothetical protein
MNAFLADSADEPTAVGMPAYAGGPSESFGASAEQPTDPSFAPQLADTPNPAPTTANPLLLIGAGIAALMLFGGNKR